MRLKPIFAFALCLLSFFTMTAQSCSLSNGGPTITSASPHPDPVTTNSRLISGCNSIPNSNNSSGSTSPLTWRINYASGPPADLPIYWPRGTANNPYSLLVFLDPEIPNNSDPTNEIRADQNAMNAWNAALSRNATGALTLKYAYSSDFSAARDANVGAYTSEQVGFGADSGGTIGGSTTINSLSDDMSTLLHATIIIDAGRDAMTTYAAAVHEFGHALGLLHSPYARSVMFPYTTPCLTSTTDSNFDYADVSFLEGAYDPVYTNSPSHTSVSAHAGCMANISPITLSNGMVAVSVRDACQGNNPPLATATAMLFRDGTLVAKMHQSASGRPDDIQAYASYTCASSPISHSFVATGSTTDGQLTSAYFYCGC